MISSRPPTPSPSRSFHHREVFGQVGFGTGGWDSDYPNSMLEILRVVRHQLRRGPALHRGRGRAGAARPVETVSPSNMVHWPRGHVARKTACRCAAPGVTRIAARSGRQDRRHRPLGRHQLYDAVLVACQSWLLTTYMQCEEQPVLAQNVDGARPHPLHAIVQDLRDGRPAVLEGARTRAPGAI